MYIFFTLSGILFVCLSSIIIYFIYELFPINKVTNFLNPTVKSLWNDINITVIPTIIWSMIEIPILGFNNLFIISVIFNLCIGSSIMYIIKYGSKLINKEDTIFVNLIAIVFATCFGQFIEYFLLKISDNNINILISVFGILLLIGLIFYLKINPPKTFFFGEKN